MDIKTVFNKSRKAFLDNTSKWEDKTIIWEVNVETFGYDEVPDVDTTLKLRDTDGDAFEMSLFCGAKEDAEEHLKEVEGIISHLAAYAEAVQESLEYLPTKQEREEYWEAKRKARIADEVAK